MGHFEPDVSAADNGDLPALDRAAAEQNVLDAEHVFAVDAGNIRHDLLPAHGNENAIGVEPPELRHGRHVIQLHLHAERGELILLRLDVLGHEPLARCLGGQHGAAAEIGAPLKQDRAEAALGQDNGCLHTGRPAADHRHAPARAVAPQRRSVVVPLAAEPGVDGAADAAVVDDLLVAAHTADALAQERFLTAACLVDPVRICELCPGHTGEIAHALAQQRLGSRGMLDDVDRDDRDLHRRLDGQRIFLLPPLGEVAGLDEGGRVFVAAAADVDARHTVVLEQFCDLHRVRFLQALGDVVAAVDAHADREVSAAGAMDALDDLADDAHPVFETAAVFIGAHIAVRAEKLVQQITVRAVELHTVGIGLLGIHGAGDEFVDHAVDLLARHFVRHAARGRVDDPARGDDLAAAVELRLALAAGVEELEEHFAVVAVQRVGQQCEALDEPRRVNLQLMGLGDAVFPVDRAKLGDQQPAAAGRPSLVAGDDLVGRLAVFCGETVAHGRHHDAVFDPQATDVTGPKQVFVVHGSVLVVMESFKVPLSKCGFFLPWFA